MVCCSEEITDHAFLMAAMPETYQNLCLSMWGNNQHYPLETTTHNDEQPRIQISSVEPPSH